MPRRASYSKEESAALNVIDTIGPENTDLERKMADLLGFLASRSEKTRALLTETLQALIEPNKKKRLDLQSRLTAALKNQD